MPHILNFQSVEKEAVAATEVGIQSFQPVAEPAVELTAAVAEAAAGLQSFRQ